MRDNNEGGRKMDGEVGLYKTPASQSTCPCFFDGKRFPFADDKQLKLSCAGDLPPVVVRSIACCRPVRRAWAMMENFRCRFLPIFSAGVMPSSFADNLVIWPHLAFGFWAAEEKPRRIKVDNEDLTQYSSSSLRSLINR